MTAARGAVAAVVAVVVVVVAVLLLRGGGSETYKVQFQNAGQLVKGDDVKVGGRKVGSVKSISLTRDSLAEIKISVNSDMTPLHAGTTAVIRTTSLSGIANRYVSLAPGPNSRTAIAAGGTIGTDSTTTPVDLDQLFDTIDPKTRLALQQLTKGSRDVINGRSKEAAQATKYLAPTLSAGSQLANELTRDSGTLEQFVQRSSRVVTNLAARQGTITSLVSNANAATGAIGAESSSLDTALQQLPGTVRRANTTFVNLRATLDDLQDLVDVSKPATRQLAPFLAQLRPLVANARPTIADLRKLVRTPGTGNDLIDLLNQAPAFDRAASTALPASTKALQQLTPIVSYLRPYSADLVGTFRDFGEGTANYDANGHYARVSPAFNAYSSNGTTLTKRPAGASRLTDLATTKVQRCPGSATSPAADGSSPSRDTDGKLACDASAVSP